MDTLHRRVQHLLKKGIFACFSLSFEPEVTRTKEASLGDYQTNAPLVLSKSLRASPKEIASQLLPFLEDPLIKQVAIGGVGFLNFHLNDEELQRLIELPVQKPEPRAETALIDYSSPNIAKDLHVGHLRSTIIGDAIANIYEFFGYKTLRINHLGDFGTQFGMLLAYIEMHHIQVEHASLPDLMQWYRSAKLIFDSSPSFKEQSQNKVVALQEGSSKESTIWRQIVDISSRGFNEIYEKLGVQLEPKGESFYQPYLSEIISIAEKKGLLSLSDGAKCLFLEGYKDAEGLPLPLIIQKKDGGYNYATTDLAALRYRIEVEGAKEIVYVVDSGQSLHFNMIFDAAKKLGLYDPSAVLVVHAPFGLVLNEDGTKMKTRSGETKRLIDLIDESIARAKKEILSRRSDICEKELESLSNILGINALKYADLSTSRIKDYLFSYDRMLRFEGNTASFLLYSYVRIKSILRKTSQKKGPFHLSHPSERTLYLHLLQYPEWLEQAKETLLPHRLAEYLYLLAQLFNQFFRDCHVEGTSEESSRLSLLTLTLSVFESAFSLLGLKTADRM